MVVGLFGAKLRGGGSHAGGLPVRLALPLCRGRGIPRPYRATYFYCPVGRGDPTPPGSFAITGNFRQVCRGRIYASRAVYPSDCIVGKIARAAYMPPLQATRKFFIFIRSRAGHAPPLPGGEFCMLRQLQGGKEGSNPLPTLLIRDFRVAI